MPENESTTQDEFFARSRFQREDEAIARRKSVSGSSHKLMKWAVSEAKRNSRTGPILDLACGNGRHLCDLADARWRVVGGDLSFPMLRAAQETAAGQSGSSLVRMEAEDLPFAENAFDVVFCARFFHHLPDHPLRERILSEMFRVARSRVILTYKARFTYEHLKTGLKALLHGGLRNAQRFYVSEKDILGIAEKYDWLFAKRYSAYGRLSSSRTIVLRPRFPGARQEGDSTSAAVS